MLLEFIAALASGFAVLGLLLMLNLLTGRRLASWVFPAGAGLGMLLYSVWSEYSWPERAIVPGSPYVEASRNEARFWYRPWTYIWPQSNRMIAIDQRFSRSHSEAPHMVQTRVVLLARWTPEYSYLVVFDCAEGARADMFEGVELQADGTVTGANWVPLASDDPVLRTACEAWEGRDGS